MSGEKKTYSPKNTDFAGVTAFVADYANHREETNHLGNVLAVVSDRKIGVEDVGNSGTVEYYDPDIVSAQDYYPFGMIMPGRSVSAGAYRYGFGGQEMDNEISGTGNSYTAEFWQYDSRLGRRWNVDPVDKPHESSYMAFSGNPIVYNDPDGDDAVATIDNEENTIDVDITMHYSEESGEDGEVSDFEEDFEEHFGGSHEVEILGEDYTVNYNLHIEEHDTDVERDLAHAEDPASNTLITDDLSNRGAAGLYDDGMIEIRMDPNAMREGTFSHEALHAMGIGHSEPMQFQWGNEGPLSSYAHNRELTDQEIAQSLTNAVSLSRGVEDQNEVKIHITGYRSSFPRPNRVIDDD